MGFDCGVYIGCILIGGVRFVCFDIIEVLRIGWLLLILLVGTLGLGKTIVVELLVY